MIDESARLAVLGREARAKVGEREIAYFLREADSTATAVLVHGWLDNAASFVPLVESLPGVRTLAIELAGHGGSSHHAGGAPYSVVGHALDMLVLLQAFSGARLVLVGHSLGASVACLVAAAIPDRVDGLVLIEGLGAWPFDDAALPEVLARHARRTAIRPPRPLSYASRRAAIAPRLSGRFWMTSGDAELIAARGLASNGDKVAWTFDPRLAETSPHQLAESQNQAILRRIRAPTTLFHAADAGGAADEVLARRAPLVEHLAIVDLAGPHHLHMQAQAAAVADVVAQYCGRAAG